MNRSLRALFAVLSLLVSAPLAQQAHIDGRVRLVREKLFVATADGFTPVDGSVQRLRGGPPWDLSVVGPTDGATLLRRFDRQLFAVNTAAGTVHRFPAEQDPQVYSFGPSSLPQDVHVPVGHMLVAPQAYVTRRNNPVLHRFNLANGLGIDIVDLSPVGGGSPIALGTMERDGSYLFVQVRVFDEAEAPSDDTGVLAVVDLVTHSLVDVEPLTPGIQGVALQGAPPWQKMQILGRTLYVSTTDGLHDSRGGIEMVNLDTLTSVGFALHESQTADMGGFVMTAPDTGFFVFHTDLLASTHLKRFSIAGGVDPGPEIVVLLGDTVDSLEYDPVWGRVFLPTGNAAAVTPGIFVVDAVTKEVVGGAPVPTDAQPHDVVLMD